MPGFSGKYYHTIDGKGRVIIPSAFREIISANYSPKIYVSNAAFDKCLLAYPFEEWVRLEEKVRGLPRMKESVKYFMRRVIASAFEVEVDKQGRLLVPQAHRQDADITGDIVVVGQVEKFEIWDRGLWDAATDPARVDSAKYQEELSELGL